MFWDLKKEEWRRGDLPIDLVIVESLDETTKVERTNFNVISLLGDLVDVRENFVEEGIVVCADFNDKADDCKGSI